MKLLPIKQPDYCFYPTLLDTFETFLKPNVVYEKYYGFSENPKYTEEEFAEKCFTDLIDKINRVPFESEAADKGTAFNEIVDCIIENRKSETMELKSFPNDGVIQADYKKQTFIFPLQLCRDFANYLKEGIPQYFVDSILPTKYGLVRLYGYADCLMPNSIHDIKTTKSYSSFKFRNHWQHIVYPFCIWQEGLDVRTFEYNVTDFKECFTETYVFEPDRDIPRLIEHCELFIDFLEMNKELITDKKIFNDLQPQESA